MYHAPSTFHLLMVFFPQKHESPPELSLSFAYHSCFYPEPPRCCMANGELQRIFTRFSLTHVPPTSLTPSQAYAWSMCYTFYIDKTRNKRKIQCPKKSMFGCDIRSFYSCVLIGEGLFLSSLILAHRPASPTHPYIRCSRWAVGKTFPPAANWTVSHHSHTCRLLSSALSSRLVQRVASRVSRYAVQDTGW